MKSIKLCALLWCLLFNPIFPSPEQEVLKVASALPITKVVLWGHKLHSHTHSYIHYAFHKAFTHLGYSTYWFDDADDVSNFDFSGSLFITEGQVDYRIPIRPDCFYILHNCYSSKYSALYDLGHCITLQVYTHKCKNKCVSQAEDWIYYDFTEQCIYMPWATDLLPHEIEEMKKKIAVTETGKTCFFVGTMGDGIFGNIHQIAPFQRACRENGIEFQQMGCVSVQKNRELVQQSYIAPAIQGEWQCREGYIPCRIFKNMSYGQLGVTNCQAVYDVFKDRVVFNPDTYQLFYDAQVRLQNFTLDERYEAMDFIKNNHTYLNRSKHLLTFMYLNYQDRQRRLWLSSSHKYGSKQRRKGCLKN